MTEHDLLKMWGQNHLIPHGRLMETPLLEMLGTDEENDTDSDEVREYESDILDDPRQYEGVVRS